MISGALDLADHNSTLELRLTAEGDRVGRSGDELFSRPLTVLGGRFGYTQVIDPQMLVQLAYEIGHAEGFQSSPYRFVGVGGDGRCGGTAMLCVPETHPSVRTRHALVVRGRRAFDDQLSLHLDYRFYVDDWGLYANTAALQLNWMHDEDGLFALRYRLHQQGAAAFYRSTYPEPSGTLRFVTRDRELSPLWTHRVALSYERGVPLGDAGPRLGAQPRLQRRPARPDQPGGDAGAAAPAGPCRGRADPPFSGRRDPGLGRSRGPADAARTGPGVGGSLPSPGRR
jgi:hypothetical protein